MELGASCICSFLCSPSLPTLQGPSPTGVWKSSSPAKLCPHTLPIGPWSLLRAKGINDWVQSVTLPSGGQARGNGPCRPWEPVLQPQVTREWARRKSTGSVQTYDPLALWIPYNVGEGCGQTRARIEPLKPQPRTGPQNFVTGWMWVVLDREKSRWLE